jgi:hypothetical protein
MPSVPREPGFARLVKTSRGRLVVPSLGDFFFAAVVLWLFFSGIGWDELLSDADTGWHIRTGQYIIARHSVPVTDLFSFSKPHDAWFAWEWLTDVLYGALFGWTGLKAIVLLSGLIISATFTILLRHLLWRGVNLFIAIGLTLICTSAAAVHFHARPHLFTLLFLVTTLWMVDKDRRSHTRSIWLLIPLMVLWTNVHGGFLVMIAVLGLLTAGTAVEVWLFERWRIKDVWRYGGLTLACALVTVINPYGLGLHRHLLEYLRSDWIRNMVMEFHSPDFHSESMLYLEILLFLGILSLPALVRRRKVVEVLWIGYFAHQALASARHIPLFVLIAAPIVGAELNTWWNMWVSRQPRKSIATIFDQISVEMSPGFRWTSGWLPVLVLVLFLSGSVIWPQDFPERWFPVKIAAAHATEIRASRVLAPDQWGDYLIFRGYPEQKVFIDGRSDFYGPELGKEYLDMVQGRYDWRALMDKYHFDLVLAPADWPLVSLLKNQADWGVVEDDGKAVLMRKLGSTP